ncbi:MAG: UDP-glucose 4-epimerase GalE [Alterinioella nitratireducens]|uniref:UDP-glucose 4-epimerase GalE n=1 Tax=Alterinioella nitratireducens TaxID=2735915 RepID=UPI004058625B
MAQTQTPHVIVTGGAGYIGAHACKVLKARGITPVTFDNLSTGWRDAVKFGPFEQGDLLDRARLDQVFAAYTPVAVMHFAALSQVSDSMADPGRYWRENTLGALNLIEATVAANCPHFIFSSTCATYGETDQTLTEDTPQEPINAYGGSKLAIEGMLRDFGARHDLQSVIFRYFNVAGADPQAEVGERHDPETHLIPLMLEAIAGRRPALTIHGTDYPTPDGTCIRDYVHVMDLAEAHVLGLHWLQQGRGSAAFNLGSGSGFSVREVVEASRAVTNMAVPVTEGARRAGDAGRLVSGSDRAARDLGWQPHRSSLPQMIADAWRWHQGAGWRD